ncbi:MAG: two component, sigma54 specific, transcriptional regulator, Fis family [Gemmatimonadetes bacterium]|nr:two component, sigma54 specific, transcriptional regulator, Fis family [Gemmatimonadota bacterium]
MKDATLLVKRPNVERFQSASFKRLLARARRFAADRRAPLLLEGESGTGKTQLARYLHSVSPRAAKPFQSVVLSTVDDALAASELFGHVNGAYTDARYARAGHFVSASGGTLFLDEIGKASLGVQQRLLHAVEYGEFRPVGSDRDMRVDVRIIAATNLPLETQVARDRFLPDLHARLAVFTLQIPPLRERRADIPLLVTESLTAHAADMDLGHVPVVHDELMAAFQAAPWPNNLRQLDATVHRLLLEADGAPVLTVALCQDEMRYLADLVDGRAPLSFERVEAAVNETGSVSAAARALGVHRTTVHRHRRGMHAPDARSEGSR